MNTLKSLVAAVALAVAGSATAIPITLDFEGATSFGSILDFYNGGTDSAGSSGANLGASFSGAALALVNDGLAATPSGNYFANAPTPGTVMFASDSSALLNVAAGFTGTLSFYYSALLDGLNDVQIFSGLDGTGTLLGEVSLLENNLASGCTAGGTPLCEFQLVSLAFGGIAQSVTFGGNPGSTAFDNISFTTVPEPGSSALVLLSLGLMGSMTRRRKSN